MRARCLASLLSLCLVPVAAAAQPPSERELSEVPEPPPGVVPEEPPPAFDLESLRTDGGLTADAAASRAIATAPGLLRARAAVEEAEAGARRAWYGVLPRVDLSARYTRLSEVENPEFGSEVPDEARALIEQVDDPEARLLFTGIVEGSQFTFPQVLDHFSLRATLSYPLSDLILTVLPTYRSLERAESSARAREEGERAAVALQAREAYYAWVRGRAAFIVAEASVAEVEAQRQQVAALVDAGASPRVDLMRVDALVAAAHVAVAQARAGVAVALAALRTLLHVEPGVELAIGEDLTRAPPPSPGALEALTTRALEERDEVRALNELIASREEAVTAARGRRWPSLGVSASVEVANPNPRVFPQTREWRGTWDVSAVISWSPNTFLDARGEANGARAQAAQVRADLAALEDVIRTDVTRSFEERAAAEAAFEAATVGLAAAEESYRVRWEQLRAGAAVTADLIDANAELTRARLDLVDAAIDIRLAAARLRRAVGEE
jgi:outer membrane protein TolC